MKILVTGGAGFIGNNLAPKHTLGDNSLAKKLLGWKLEINLEEGIKKCKEYSDFDL
jgi:nucleoside-diphosphate-sugar epimerase